METTSVFEDERAAGRQEGTAETILRLLRRIYPKISQNVYDQIASVNYYPTLVEIRDALASTRTRAQFARQVDKIVEARRNCDLFSAR